MTRGKSYVGSVKRIGDEREISSLLGLESENTSLSLELRTVNRNQDSDLKLLLTLGGIKLGQRS